MRQNNDIAESFATSKLTLLVTRPPGCCAICKRSSYTKNEYNLFYHKLNVEYFLFNNLKKKKKAVFREKTVKNSFEGPFDYFLGKGLSCPKN